MGKNKESQIIIKTEGDALLWKVDTDKEFEKEVQLKVQEGCQAIVYLDGQYRETFFANTNIQWKKFKKNDIKIYGTNAGKDFEIKFGFGNIVFHDDVIDDTVNVGIHGTCNFRIQDGSKLHLVFTGYDKVTPDDIRTKYFPKLQTVVTSKCSAVFERHGYRDVQQTLLELSTIIRESIEAEMFDSGIFLDSCNVMSVHFPEGYEQRFQNKVDENNDSYNNRNSSEDQVMNDLRIIRELNNLNGNNNNNNQQVAKLLCPKCGRQVQVGTKFCPTCGARLG